MVVCVIHAPCVYVLCGKAMIHSSRTTDLLSWISRGASCVCRILSSKRDLRPLNASGNPSLLCHDNHKMSIDLAKCPKTFYLFIDIVIMSFKEIIKSMHDFTKFKLYKMVTSKNISLTPIPQLQVSPSRGKHVTIISVTRDLWTLL